MTHHDQIMVSQMLSHEPKVSHPGVANEGGRPIPKRKLPDQQGWQQAPLSLPSGDPFLRYTHLKAHRGNCIVS